MIIVPYTFFTAKSPRITGVGDFGFEEVGFVKMTWDWTQSWSWGWYAERLIESSCLSYWFSVSSISFSSSTLKRLRDTDLYYLVLQSLWRDKNARIFWGYIGHFLILPLGKNTEPWLVFANKFPWIIQLFFLTMIMEWMITKICIKKLLRKYRAKQK